MGREPLRVAVVGVGYFGSYHCEKLAVLPTARLAGVVDVDPDRARRAADRFGVEAYTHHQSLIGKVDAAIIAVPTDMHYPVAVDLLEAGLDLLVEKPLAGSLVEAEGLVRLAQRRALCLQVGHLERFNPIMADALARIVRPRFVRMERMGPYPGRGASVDVVMELMIHDLDILGQISGAPLRAVSASGWSVVSGQLDVVSARLEFSDGLVAELTASRASSQTRRAFSVLGAEGLLEVDLGRRRLRWNQFVDGLQKTEDLEMDAGDPLLEQDRSFIDILTNGRVPVAGGEAGRAAVALAERILGALARPDGPA